MHFLSEHDTINVAGNRDAGETAVQAFLVDVFRSALGTPIGGTQC